MFAQYSDNVIAHSRRHDVLTSDLKDTGTVLESCGQQGREVEIVSENDVLTFTRPLQNYRVFCSSITNAAPMEGAKTMVGKELCP